MVTTHASSSVGDGSTLPLETQVYIDYFRNHEAEPPVSIPNASRDASRAHPSSPFPDVLPESPSRGRSDTDLQDKSDSPATSSPITEVSPTYLEPRTADSAGKKRDHRGNFVALSAPSSDPTALHDLPQAFTNRFPAPLTQLFDTTQADSDPVSPGADGNADAIFNRPSPCLSRFHPVTPGPATSSAPHVPTTSSAARPILQPRGAYLSIAESQEVRGIEHTPSHLDSSSPPGRLSPGADWFDPPSTSKERVKRTKAESRLRSRMARLTAPGSHVGAVTEGVSFISDASPRIDPANLKTPARVTQQAIYVSSDSKPPEQEARLHPTPTLLRAKKPGSKQPVGRIASTPQHTDDTLSIGLRASRTTRRDALHLGRPDSSSVSAPELSAALNGPQNAPKDGGLETSVKETVANSQNENRAGQRFDMDKLVPRTQSSNSVEAVSKFAGSPPEHARAVLCSQAIHETSPLRSQRPASDLSEPRRSKKGLATPMPSPCTKTTEGSSNNDISGSLFPRSPGPSFLRGRLSDSLASRRYTSDPGQELTSPRPASAGTEIKHYSLLGADRRLCSTGNHGHPLVSRNALRDRPSTAPPPETGLSRGAGPHGHVLASGMDSRHALGGSLKTVDTTRPLPSLSKHENCVPYRVWARFRGANTGPSFYPASCLRKANHPSRKTYRVLFDDDNEDEVESSSIKELVLQVGDAVKVDRPGLRSNVYTICGFSESVELSNSTVDSILKTDFYGHHGVSLALKGSRRSVRNGTGPAKNRLLSNIPVSALYISSTMWRPFEMRQVEPAFAAVNSVLTNSHSAAVTPLPLTIQAPSVDSRRHRGVFYNMAFAISFLRPAETRRKKIRDIVEANGGIILEEGFSCLFDESYAGPAGLAEINGDAEPRQDALTLRNEMAGLHFVALIADVHSRRAKYLQALVLNLPCLSARWVMDSADEDRIAPWERYLLPAGISSYLDGAVRSRVIRGFGSSTSKLPQLSEMIAHRSRPLHGRKALVAIAGDRRQAHMFLAHALGACEVWGADSVEAARLMLEDGPQFQVAFVDGEGRVIQEAKSKLWPYVDRTSLSGKRDPGTHNVSGPNATLGRLVTDEALIQAIIMDTYDF